MAVKRACDLLRCRADIHHDGAFVRDQVSGGGANHLFCLTRKQSSMFIIDIRDRPPRPCAAVIARGETAIAKLVQIFADSLG